MTAKMKEKEAISAKLRVMGESMRKLIGEIALEINKPVGELTLTTLAKLHEKTPEGNRLLTSREKLLAISAKTAELNNFNRSLLGNAVNITKKCIKYINNLTGGAADTYSSGKIVEGKMRSGMILTRTY
jgi:hypothetical protein